MVNNIIWVTWEDHRRSRELAEAFDAKYCPLLDKRSRYYRYVALAIRTLKLLKVERPTTVFCQNPSIVLATLLCLVKRVFGYRLIVDRHTNFKFKTLNSKRPVWLLFNALSRFTTRAADLTIITNDYLKEFVENWGGTGFVLPDKLPCLNLRERRVLDGEYNFAFICTFSEDEPYEDIVQSAHLLSDDVHIYITGNYKKWKRYTSGEITIPSNVHLEGFLKEKDYQALIGSVDALIVLTDMDYTLNCGAYEGVELGKALILSDTPTIRAYFSKGVVYSRYDKQSIAASIALVVQDIDALHEGIAQLKVELLEDWAERFSQIKTISG